MYLGAGKIWGKEICTDYMIVQIIRALLISNIFQYLVPCTVVRIVLKA